MMPDTPTPDEIAEAVADSEETEPTEEAVDGQDVTVTAGTATATGAGNNT